MECPFCGGKVQEYGWSSSGGEVRASLCCDVSMALIENFEVFAGLPKELQEATLERDKAERAEIIAKVQQHAVAGLKSWNELNRKYAHLMKGEHETIPFDREGEQELWL